MSGEMEAVQLHVTGIALHAFHGAYPFERRRPGRFFIDLEIEGALERAVSTDRLEDTIDYAHLVKAVREISRTRKFSLIESLAGAIADGLLERFARIQRIGVRVEKLPPRGLGSTTCAAVHLIKTRGHGASTSRSDRTSVHAAP